MTEKRYYAHKHLLEENKVHDKICHNFMNIDETVEHMNNQYWKYKRLKQQNERQAKQLDKLYRLIEEKNWIALSDIIDDFKRCEKQLQKEWGTYCDFE